MADKLLESSAISAFCSSVATMLAAGVQTDEAVHMLSENRAESQFKRVCDEAYSHLVAGETLSESMQATEAFPAYAVEMVRVGEASGRTERVLRSLGSYYDSERRSFAKLQNAVGYPAALLCVMSIILAFTVIWILPIFSKTYDNIAGSLTNGSFSMVGVSVAIGWVALIVVLAATIAALVLWGLSHNESGRMRVAKLFEKFPATRQAMYQIASSRFTNAARSVRRERRARRRGAAPSHSHGRPRSPYAKAAGHAHEHDRFGQPAQPRPGHCRKRSVRARIRPYAFGVHALGFDRRSSAQPFRHFL